MRLQLFLCLLKINVSRFKMLDIKPVSACAFARRCFWMAICAVSQRLIQDSPVINTAEAYVVRKFRGIDLACLGRMEFSTHCKK